MSRPRRVGIERHPASKADIKQLAEHWDRIVDADGSTFAFVPSGAHPAGALLARMIEAALAIDADPGPIDPRWMEAARALRSELVWQSNDSVLPLAAALQRVHDQGWQEGRRSAVNPMPDAA